MQAPAPSRPVQSEDSGEDHPSRARGSRLPREEPEPDPLVDDPRADRSLIDRLLQVQPTRPDISQSQRRMQLERVLDWLNAVAVTVSRVGYRFEWRLSPMPVRWRPDDRGLAFDLGEYLTAHSWVPVGQLYGSPPPTDQPLQFADYVYPPYEADRAYFAYFAKCVRTWAYYHASQSRLARRREQYAARRRQLTASTSGECAVLFCTQEHWELRELTFRCSRWVDTRNPPVEPLVMPRAEALPEHLHPCGVWGDLLESPTEREGMGPAPQWPLPGVEELGPPPEVTLLYPAVRDPAGREAAAAAPPRREAEPAAAPPRQRPTAEERRKRARTERAPAPAARPSRRTPSSTPSSAAPSAPSLSGLLETPLVRALAGESLCLLAIDVMRSYR